VELVERAIGNSSKAGDLVADYFLGSGTTLIACERLGRKCRAVEISPAYCAVAIQRWADMTGQEPELIK
jgi:DNA modification methylase